MTDLIQQRGASDCAICCIAMALGRSYEDVMIAALEAKAWEDGVGMRDERAVLRLLGLTDKYEAGENIGEFASRHRDWAVSPEYFRHLAWGRRALLAVPSLNKPGGWHMVYWDGARLFDPSTKLVYVQFDQLLPNNITLFRETGLSAPAAALAS